MSSHCSSLKERSRAGWTSKCGTNSTMHCDSVHACVLKVTYVQQHNDHYCGCGQSLPTSAMHTSLLSV